MESNIFLQVEPYVSQTDIKILDITALENLLETQFEDVNLVGTAKHKLFKLCQTNKDLEMFLNAFFVLAKKAKLNNL